MATKKLKSGICCSTSYMSQTRDQKRFTISDMAADWHELMIPQRTTRPSIARVSKQLDPHPADTPPPQLDALGLYPIASKLLLIPHPAEGKRLS